MYPDIRALSHFPIVSFRHNPVSGSEDPDLGQNLSLRLSLLSLWTRRSHPGWWHHDGPILEMRPGEERGSASPRCGAGDNLWECPPRLSSLLASSHRGNEQWQGPAVVHEEGDRRHLPRLSLRGGG